MAIALELLRPIRDDNAQRFQQLRRGGDKAGVGR
jgi:hypothetical protein